MAAPSDENKRSPLKAWVRALEKTAPIERDPFLTLPALIERLADRFEAAPGTDFPGHDLHLPLAVRGLQPLCALGARAGPSAVATSCACHRRLSSRLGNSVARYVPGIYCIHDCTSGFRAICHDVIRRIDLQRFRVQGYVFQIALLHAVVGGPLPELRGLHQVLHHRRVRCVRQSRCVYRVGAGRQRVRGLAHCHPMLHH